MTKDVRTIFLALTCDAIDGACDPHEHGGARMASSSLGRIEVALSRPCLRDVTVTDSLALGDRFRLVTLGGESLRGVAWTPGAKVQVQLGNWAYRTYTPLSWDAATGSTQLLLYIHGDGPGAAWSRSLKRGNSFSLFGPRSSLDLTAVERPALLFGDETSVGLTHALRFSPRRMDDALVVLEVGARAEAESVLDALGIRGVELVERKPNDTHASELEEWLARHLRSKPGATCVLTGKSTSIQTLNRCARKLGLSSGQIRTKAYWAPGKTGLD